MKKPLNRHIEFNSALLTKCLELFLSYDKHLTVCRFKQLKTRWHTEPLQCPLLKSAVPLFWTAKINFNLSVENSFNFLNNHALLMKKA